MTVTVPSARLRALLSIAVVIAGVAAVSDLLGGPSFGKWQPAITALAMVAWWVGFNAKDRHGDRADRRIFWVGVLGSAVLLVAGVVDALA
jgi:hypothetical protein